MSGEKTKYESLINELLCADPKDRVALLTSCGDPDAILMLMIDDISKLAVVNAEQAVEATRMAIELSDQLDNSLARARSRRAATRALAYAGRFDESQQTGTEAVRIAAEAGHHDEVGRANLALMHPLIETGRVADAIAAGHRAHKLFEQIGDAALAARADINLGVVYQRSDDQSSAMECFDRARPHFDDDLLTRGHLDNNRGEALVALNQFEDAERAYQDALEAFDSSDAELTAAIAESNLADLAVRRGRLAEAMSYFESAHRRLEASRSITHLSRLLAEQADAHLLLGLPQDALIGYEKALVELLNCGLSLEAARARAGMGVALFRVGRMAEAETSLAAAAVGYEELGHATARARVDVSRAEIALSRQQPDLARSIAMKSLVILHDRPADAAQVRLLLARIAALSGMNETALVEIEAGLISARELDLAPLLADLFHSRALLRFDSGQLGEAIDDLNLAVHQVERIHGSLQARRFRMAFLGDRTLVYEDLARAHLAQNTDSSIKSALHAAERCKGRGLLDELRDAIVEPANDTASTTDDNRRELHVRLLEARSELEALYSRIADEHFRETATAPDRKRWKDVLRDREAELERIEARLEIATSQTVSDTEDTELSCLPDELMEGSLIIEYFIARGELIAFAINTNRTVHWKSLGEVGDLEAMAKRLRFQLERGLHATDRGMGRQLRLVEDFKREAQRLHQRLLKPFESFIRAAQRVTLIPHGPLHAIPMHVLHDGDRYLIERCDVHYAPSLAMLTRLQRRSTEYGGKRKMLAIGVADDRVPGAEREARAIAERFGVANRYIGGEASLDAVVKAMPTAWRIHFAGHGSFSGDSPFGSGLKLSDGWLTARRVYNMRLSAELVTLSACETGRSTVGAGDELMGFVRAMLTAGARALLLSYWRVDDEIATELMTRFYEYLGEATPSTGRTAASIRAAQLDLMSRNPHPASWGPFALIGPP